MSHDRFMTDVQIEFRLSFNIDEQTETEAQLNLLNMRMDLFGYRTSSDMLELPFHTNDVCFDECLYVNKSLN